MLIHAGLSSQTHRGTMILFFSGKGKEIEGHVRIFAGSSLAGYGGYIQVSDGGSHDASSTSLFLWKYQLGLLHPL
jgi:hypothetical protein